ncbi:MAG: UvrD-helicase domain-containing protein [Candidatus Eiseniibacteriota bacterium]
MKVASGELVDAVERARIRSDLGTTFVVEAAAGTGKTTELVRRIVEALATGAHVGRVVAVTFTEKAAGEMKLRLRAGLERARRDAQADSERRRNLVAALARLEEARVDTIHAFCRDLLRERSVEAGVDPRFEVLPEPEAERVYGEAFHLWLQQQLTDPPEGVRRSLRRAVRGGADSRDGPVERLRRAGWALLQWRDHPAPWRRDPFDRDAEVDALFSSVVEFAELSARCSKKEKDYLYLDTEPARRLVREVQMAEEVRSRDHDGLEAALVDLAHDRNFPRVRRGAGAAYGPDLPRADVHDAHQKILGRLREFQRAADADLAAVLRRELAETIGRYETLKSRTGRVDFLDLLLRARDLVRDDPTVRAEFQQRFTHLFVDEFQDTDPLQAEVLLLLAADDPSVSNWREARPKPGKLFLVADPKQSIYRFRRADVGLYHEIRDLLVRRDAELLHLTTSFRSVRGIQDLVNAAFPEFLDGDADAQQAAWVELSTHREDPPDQPAVVVLPVPRPYGRGGHLAKVAIEKSYPDAVGAFVQWLLDESGWEVTERDGEGGRVPVAARHVCLLFRRFDSLFAGDLTRPYVEALEARGVRHLLVGGRSFHDREEVETLRTALTAVEWPEDELSVFATLRGSLFAIGDEELLEYRHRWKRLHPFRVPEDLPERLESVGQALRVVADLSRGRNRRPIAETVSRLLEATRAHAGFALRPSGEQALANVLHVAEQARNYERAGGISFRGFVERLDDDAEGRKSEEAPILEEGSEGVRLMTVHRAKGLEFPVVVLADPTATLAFENPDRAVDAAGGLAAVRLAGCAPVELGESREREVKRDAAEGVRLAYVAATRARDLLVVPAVGDERFQDVRGQDNPARGGWLSPLYDAIYPPRDSWGEGEAAKGLPPFGSDSVLDRPFDVGAAQASVRPGRHRIGGHSVVWWDPALLALGATPPFGIRREELLSKDVDETVVQKDAHRHDAWAKRREELLAAASVPDLDVRTARTWAQTSREAANVETIDLPRAAGRPSGPRFGALVHAALATVPLDADADRIRQIAELQARILGAPPQETAAATRVVAEVLKHPLLARARLAEERGDCRRETPVTDRLGDGVLVEGVVDLAFRENGRWTVVDFKTDREAEADLEAYRRQVSLYASIIARATAEPATPLLLRI